MVLDGDQAWRVHLMDEHADGSVEKSLNTLRRGGASDRRLGVFENKDRLHLLSDEDGHQPVQAGQAVGCELVGVELVP